MISPTGTATTVWERFERGRGPVPAADARSLLDDGHPLTGIERCVSEVLLGNAEFRFSAAPGMPPTASFVRALMLQVLYALEADDSLLEQLRYDLRFRWFAGLRLAEPVWSTCAHGHARTAFLGSASGRRLLQLLLRAVRPLAQAWPGHFRYDDSLPERWLTSAGADARRTDLLEAAGVRAQTRSVDARLMRVLDRVVACFSDCELNGDVLAADLAMSRRTLYYLFEAQGLTPAMAIRNLRLSYCRRQLEDPRLRTRKVGAIALDHGFRNVCTFSRCFKQRYGVAPRACRPARESAR